MRIQSILMAVVLALAVLVPAHAKTFQVHLPVAVVAGDTLLPAGEYKLRVEGSTAILTDGANKSYASTVKVETGSRKYPQTNVVTANRFKDEPRIKAIELGGTNIRLEFQD